jgi:hypothetical protein
MASQSLSWTVDSNSPKTTTVSTLSLGCRSFCDPELKDACINLSVVDFPLAFGP